MIRFATELICFILFALLMIGIFAIVSADIKRAKTKSTAALFLDCVPSFEKGTFLAVVDWLVGLILFDAPSLLINLVLKAIHGIIVGGVRFVDAHVTAKAGDDSQVEI